MATLETLREEAADTWWRLTMWAGHPSEVARRGFASFRVRKLMRDWIGNLEKLVRRIVYLAALMIELPAPKPAAARSASIRRPHAFPRRRTCLRFMCKLREPEPRPSAWRSRSIDDSPTRPVRIAHLARRMEALRKAIWHTRPHALRMARLLARRTAANKPFPQLVYWMIPSVRRTGGQHQVHDHMTALEPLIEAELAKRGALPELPPEEPG